LRRVNRDSQSRSLQVSEGMTAAKAAAAPI
jgi:hypothetical protein